MQTNKCLHSFLCPPGPQFSFAAMLNLVNTPGVKFDSIKIFAAAGALSCFLSTQQGRPQLILHNYLLGRKPNHKKFPIEAAKQGLKRFAHFYFCRNDMKDM